MMLEASAIEKWYLRGKGDSNRFYAVSETSLILKAGEVTVLTGRSGSGKTTLMNMMAGLLKPDAGRVLLDGRDLYEQSDKDLSLTRNRCFGMIPQGADVLEELTVMENIMLSQGIYPQPKDVSLQDAEERCRQLLEQMGISSLCDAPARELSGGERRRMCIARALAGNPACVFADEPTSDLDDENTMIVLSMLRQAAVSGSAVMIVSHDAESVDYADVTYRMDGGVLTSQNEKVKDRS